MMVKEDYIAIPVKLIKNMCKALFEYEHSDRDCFSEIHDACVDIDAFYRDKLNDPRIEDCISRQAVFEYIEASDAELGHSSENELVCQDIKELPPVIPVEKAGRWIDKSIPDMAQFMCSRCERRSFFKTNYCPNCGAKMEWAESDG